MKVLVLGANGMIGSTMLRVLAEDANLDVVGTVRRPLSEGARSALPMGKVIADIELELPDVVANVLDQVRPGVVINCAGITKHRPAAENPLQVIPVNALLPHRLSALCKLSGARLIHVSTDCVFSGERGCYSESDLPDARDLYGRTKAMGELHEDHTVTLRTSTIGHELGTCYGLLEWFLSQGSQCSGYTRAVFSGVPTVEFARVVRDVVISDTSLTGLYNVASEPIAKYELLRLIASEYSKKIEIRPDSALELDRSLDPSRFAAATGYVAPGWPDLIRLMHDYA